MGVPKFFRWLSPHQHKVLYERLTGGRMSERYPAISQLIAENRIPEFDNLCELKHSTTCCALEDGSDQYCQIWT